MDLHSFTLTSAFAENAFTTVHCQAYMAVLEPWAHVVHFANASCVAVALDMTVCNEAKRIGCQCIKSFDDAPNYGNSGTQKGWHKARRDGIKMRFIGALSVMEAGRPVVMHDADVFFRPHGLLHLLSFIEATREQVSNLDVLAQNNGKRDTVGPLLT